MGGLAHGIDTSSARAWPALWPQGHWAQAVQRVTTGNANSRQGRDMRGLQARWRISTERDSWAWARRALHLLAYVGTLCGQRTRAAYDLTVADFVDAWGNVANGVAGWHAENYGK